MEKRKGGEENDEEGEGWGREKMGERKSGEEEG